MNRSALRALAGPVAALLCAWLLCPVPPPRRLPLPALFALGLGYICLVALAAILTGWLVRAPFPALIRSTTAALWFAPLVILAVEGSALAAIPLIFLVVLATPLFGLDRSAIPPSPDARLLRQFPSSMIAAAAIQLAAVEALLHHQDFAGILLPPARPSSSGAPPRSIRGLAPVRRA